MSNSLSLGGFWWAIPNGSNPFDDRSHWQAIVLSLDDFLKPKLAQRRASDRYRRRHLLQSPQGPEIWVDGQPRLAFCSNDYLGLANHPDVVTAFAQAAQRFGVGSGAAHLVCGHSSEHHALEEELADWTGRPRALLFSTGYMANLGVVSALLGRRDSIIQDKLNHASLLDAAQLSGAKLVRFAHNDMTHLQTRLQAHTGGQGILAVDGVFSMDGDLAPLPELARLAQQHQRWLMVDDAHGLGCLGAMGAGTVAHFGASNEQVPILMGTLGKALGTFGAFVAGSEALIEALIQFARTYIYTTAVPPAIAAATRTSLRLVQTETWRREHLQQLIQRFRQGALKLGLSLMPSETPIQPILLGDEAKALFMAEVLREQGIWVSAIRPPTVPVGTSRLRITLSAGHSTDQVDRLLDALSLGQKRLSVLV